MFTNVLTCVLTLSKLTRSPMATIKYLYAILAPSAVTTAQFSGSNPSTAVFSHTALGGITDAIDRRDCSRVLIPPPTSVHIGW